MDIEQVVATEQVMYREQILTVLEQIADLGMSSESEVRIYPLEFGWYGTVLVREFVLVCIWHCDHLSIDIQPFSGFFPNGALIHTYKEIC